MSAEVAQYEMLLKFDPRANNNKFYEMKLMASGDLVCRYGRVDAGAQEKTYPGHRFNSILNQKLKKGYKRAEILDSQQQAEISNQHDLMQVAMDQITCRGDKALELIKHIAAANIHRIVSNTGISYNEDDGLFRTPLGIVRKEAVDRANAILNEIQEGLQQGASDNRLLDLNAQYFQLIPSKVKTTRDKRYLIFTDEAVKKQRSICNALIDTLDMLETAREKVDAEQRNELPQIFDAEIAFLEDKQEWKRIVDLYEETKNDMHGRRIGGSQVENIYRIRLGDQQEPFEKMSQKIGNVHELWHGTRMANVLSIMSRGLLMPTQSPGQKAGAAFGYGLYFGSQSSKSLQYCDGLFWASGSQSRDKIYLFLASVAVGNYYVPPNATQSRPPKGYHSYWAKPGETAYLRNDEIIIFNTGQVRLDYLLEISL